MFDNLYEDIYIVLTYRCGVRSILPKSTVWHEDILTQLDEDRFKMMMRVNRQQFSYLVQIISNDIEFNKSHSCEQLSLALQLAIVLYRLGSSGESGSIRKIASSFGIGDGGTIYKITNRVFSVFLRLKCKYISWPSKEERLNIVSETFHELPYCIGYVDGTEIKLSETPVTNGVQYFSRKHIYSMKLQITCDYRLQIRHLVTGYPGSVHDARMFSNCALSTASENYFASQQWIAADSAYSLSGTVITPYRNNSRFMTPAKRKSFNLRHSKYRVRAEHCIGLLKERFGSLKELRIRIQNEKSHIMCSKWITVCCIIHNILLSSSGNHCEVDTNECSCHDDDNEENDLVDKKFEIKRQALYSLMFE